MPKQFVDENFLAILLQDLAVTNDVCRMGINLSAQPRRNHAKVRTIIGRTKKISHLLENLYFFI